MPVLTDYLNVSFQTHKNPPVLSPQGQRDWIKTACDNIEIQDDSCAYEDKYYTTPTDIASLDLEDPLKTKGMLMCHQNVNSIRNKIDEIKWFIMWYKPYVFALTETKLDNDRDPDGIYVIDNYTMIRKDRIGKEGVGSIVYVTKQVDFEEVDLTIDIPDLCEVTVIKKKGVKPILFISIYNHPNTKLQIFQQFFIELCSSLNAKRDELVIVGDFNIDLLKNINGEFDSGNVDFFFVCREFDLKQLMQGPTHNKGSLLDHVYINNKSFYNVYGHFEFAGSDHDLCFIVRKQPKFKYEPRTIKVRNWKRLTGKK